MSTGSVSSIRFYQEKIEKIYSTIVARLEAGETISDFDRVNIREEQFTAIYGIEHSFFNLLENQKFTALKEAVFGRGHYQKALPDSCTRSIHVSEVGRDKTSFSPLAMHIDGIYHETWSRFSINFWIPFSTCGTGTNFPSLTLYPAGFKDIRQSLGIHSASDFQGIMASVHNPQPMEPLYPMLEMLYSAKHIAPIMPRFEVGDVMVFNSWTPHATYWDGKMSGCRRNLELRFQGNDWDPLPVTG